MKYLLVQQCLIGGLFMCAFSTTLMANSQASNSDYQSSEQVPVIVAETLPSLSARHIRRHEPSDRELIRADVAISPDGLRVRQAVQGDRHREMLQNFNSNESWLIDHKRSVAHRLPLEDDMSDDISHPGEGASFLSTAPCGAWLTAENAGRGQWRGRNVDTWYCKNADGETEAIEFVDRIYGIVVYKRTADGLIDELSDLKERAFSEDYFRPDTTLRSVDRHEFFGRIPSLKRYKEAE